MERYTKYKDSGIAWIGEIPEHWEIKKIKHIFNFHNNQRIPLSAEERGKMMIKKYDYYGASGIIDKVDNYIFEGNYILFGEDGANLLARNSPLSFKATGQFWVNNHAHILTVKNGEINYFVNALECANYETIVSGSAQPKITAEALGSFLTIFPPLEEQKAIAAYLDRKTAEIDQLIAQKERLIELYEEEKTAIINEAVTKGINPDVKLKPTAINWLGDIPEHWEVIQIKRAFVLQRGADIRQADQTEGLVPVVSSGGIASYHNQAYAKAPGVLVGRKGTIGNVHYVDVDYWPHDTTLWIIDFRGNNPKFVYYKLLSMNLKELDTGSSNPTLNRNVIHPIKTSWTNLKEQNSIVEYIEKETARIDAKIAKTKRIIELQKEYRTALISEAVTGKIKVSQLDQTTN